MKLVLFDFDGTLTKKDSFIDFIIFYKGRIKFYKGLIYNSPMLFLYALKIIDNSSAKEKLFSYFFKFENKHIFQNTSERYAKERLERILRPKGIEQIKWHKDNNHKIIIVSASIENWIDPWCQKNNIELIATKIEIKNNVLTGNFLTKNCYGKEKVKRLKNMVDLKNYEEIYSYGDSKGDNELLAISDFPIYKPFR